MSIVNVKVKNIGPTYENLKEWMEDPKNEYIGRAGIVFINKERYPKKPSQWANPYPIKIYGREKCMELYEKWIREKLDKDGVEDFKKLRGKILGCWCKPELCHGDVIIKILNELE